MSILIKPEVVINNNIDSPLVFRKSEEIQASVRIVTDMVFERAGTNKTRRQDEMPGLKKQMLIHKQSITW